MDWGVLGLIALVIGIVAGIVQVLDYLEKRRRKPEEPSLPLPPRPEIPHNLPQPGEFIGREREKAEVREALASRSYLICIDGIGGIGKTALALEVAHDCLKASKGELPANGIPTFDAFVWTTAKDRELALSDILDTIARTLDYPYIAQLPPEEKPPETAKLLRQYKCLLIVDNFETITDDAVRDFLLNLPEPSKALITSRYQKLRQARAVSLRGMEQGEALALIRSEGKRLGLPAVESAEEKVLLRLYEATGGAPLAIKWAVGQMKQRGQSLDTVLDYLYEARGDIFENIFARSWSLLSENARRVLMVMPIFATSASKEAIEAASDVHKWDLDEALGQLVEMWLVEASEELDEAKRRYSIHPLTRAYVGARLKGAVTFEKEARIRLSSYFINFMKARGGKRFHNIWTKSALKELEVEVDNVLAIMDWCYDTREWKAVIELMSGISEFLGLRGYLQERIMYGNKAIKAAKQLKDKYALGWLNAAAISWPYLMMGYYEKAKACAEEGLALSKEVGDLESAVLAMRYLARIAREEGLMDKSQQIIKEALKIAWIHNFKSLFSAVCSDIVYYFALKQGKYKEAERWLRRACKGFEELNDKGRLGDRSIDLGYAIFKQGRLSEAQHLYEKGLVLSQEFGRQDSVANAWYRLALLEKSRGDFIMGQKYALNALAIYERLGMKKAIKETQELVERLEARITETRK